MGLESREVVQTTVYPLENVEVRNEQFPLEELAVNRPGWGNSDVSERRDRRGFEEDLRGTRTGFGGHEREEVNCDVENSLMRDRRGLSEKKSRLRYVMLQLPRPMRILGEDNGLSVMEFIRRLRAE